MGKARQERREERKAEGEGQYGGMFDIIPESAKRASDRADIITAKFNKAMEAFCRAWLEG